MIKGQAEGLTGLEQRITLHADSPMIDLSARFLKQDVRTPEAIYFAFPLNLPADWKAHFDTAGIPTELDAEQIPGSCRDWVTVDTFASVHQARLRRHALLPRRPAGPDRQLQLCQETGRDPAQREPACCSPGR